MRLDHLLSKEIIFLCVMCHRVGGVWLFFVFWVERLLVRSLKWWSARVCDDQAFVVLSFFCVGWLLVRCWVSGMTHVLLFLLYRLLRAAGGLLWWFVLWCVGVV